MDVFDSSCRNPCEPVYYCSEIDDYRPTQSTLLTRFTTTDDCSNLWRTSNQEYGAFYYRSMSPHCIADRLKAKIHRRHDRFQHWLSYQKKCQNGSSLMTGSINQNSNIFPPNKNETVRITHRKRFVSKYDDEQTNIPPDRCSLSPCGEDGLITDYIVKKVMNKLHCLINPGEHCDVTECAQMLVSDILSARPSLCTDDIVDRVVTMMTTPPTPCRVNTPVEVIPCPSPRPLPEPCAYQSSQEISPCVPVTVTDPLIEFAPPMLLPNDTTPIFNNLAALENAIAELVGTHHLSPCEENSANHQAPWAC